MIVAVVAFSAHLAWGNGNVGDHAIGDGAASAAAGQAVIYAYETRLIAPADSAVTPGCLREREPSPG